jgi:hypothetical protein
MTFTIPGLSIVFMVAILSAFAIALGILLIALSFFDFS